MRETNPTLPRSLRRSRRPKLNQGLETRSFLNHDDENGFERLKPKPKSSPQKNKGKGRESERERNGKIK